MTGTVQLAAHLVTPVVTSKEGGVQIGGSTYPQAMLLCLNCGFTRYFNTMILEQNSGQ